MLRLPQITGYVLGGVLVGPFGLNLLRAEGLPSLAVVRLATCLAHRRPAITGCPTLLHTATLCKKASACPARLC